MTVGIFTYQIGIGLIGAIVIGFFAGALGLLAGQHIFSVAHPPIIRLIVALLFAVPAACAGYSMTFGLAQVGIASEWWRQVFALVGAVVVGCTAWARLAILAIAAPGVFSDPPRLSLGPSLGPAIPDRRLSCTLLHPLSVWNRADS